MVRVGQGFLSLLVTVLAGMLAISLLLNIRLVFFKSSERLGVKAPLEFDYTCTRMSEAQKAEASGTICIRADGSIDPSTAPISTVDNVTYTLTGNISSAFHGIAIERDNITIDGAGYTLQGRKGLDSEGIDLTGRNNTSIKNILIREFCHGIYLMSSHNNTIAGNNLTNNTKGVYLRFPSFNNTVSENSMTDDDVGVGIWLSSFNNTISRNNITNNYTGVDLFETNDNTVFGNNVANNFNGIRLYCSNGNIVSGNNITHNCHGIWFSYSSCNNIVTGNSIAANSPCGIWLVYSSGNLIYHNDLVDNAQQARLESTFVNVWDDGYPSGGNHWSDFNGSDLYSGPYQNETGSDGIGDMEYAIGGNNTDNYPLMGMYRDFNATSQHRIQTVCHSTISDFQFNGTAISFNITGQDGTMGFCRVCIPTALMNGTYRVFVNGAEISSSLLSCSNGTYSYLYFDYAHSTQEVTIIPELPSFLVLALFVIVTFLAVAVLAKRVAANQARAPLRPEFEISLHG